MRLRRKHKNRALCAFFVIFFWWWPMPNSSLQLTPGNDERLDKINENLSLLQKIGGLTFTTDAYLLAAFARCLPGSSFADLGSGTGVAAFLCLARDKYRHGFAVEIQHEFCDLIRRNATLNHLEDRITVLEKDVREIRQADTAGTVSAVISNPPYMPAGSGFASATVQSDMARRELNGTAMDFCAAAARILSTGGLFYTVYRPDRMAELISALRENHLEPKRMVTVYPDTKSKPCLVLIESKKDAAPGLLQPPPLIMYESHESRIYTPAFQRIYDEFTMEFLFTASKGVKS